MAVTAGTQQGKVQKLKSRAARAIKLPQRRNIRSIGPDAAGIHRQSQILCLLNAQPGIIQFSQTITFRGNQPIASREIHRARRPVRAPALSYNGGKIIPAPRLVWRRAAQDSSGADSNSIVVRKSPQKTSCIDKVIG